MVTNTSLPNGHQLMVEVVPRVLRAGWELAALESLGEGGATLSGVCVLGGIGLQLELRRRQRLLC